MDTIGCSADIVTLDPNTLDDVLQSLIDVARAAGVEERGHALVASLRERLAVLAEKLDGLPRPKVFVLEWVEPAFLAGHWVPDVVIAGGGEPVLCTPGSRSYPDDVGRDQRGEPRCDHRRPVRIRHRRFSQAGDDDHESRHPRRADLGRRRQRVHRAARAPAWSTAPRSSLPSFTRPSFPHPTPPSPAA